MLCPAEKQRIRTNYMKRKVDKTTQSPICNMCHKKNQTISHIVGKCEKSEQKEYNVARIVHLELCAKYNLKKIEKWYEHDPKGVVENEEVKILSFQW